MPRILTFLFACCVLLRAANAVERIEKPALLVLPEAVSIQEGISALVEFRWDEDVPVTLDTWSIRGELSTYGQLKVFDETGKEVAMFYPMSMPLTPTGKRTVVKGEVLKIALYKAEYVSFQHTGRYYAIATFSSAFAGRANVRFTTKKRWFQVIDGKSKPT